MRGNHSLYRHGRLAASLCAFMAASVLASAPVGPEPGDVPVRADRNARPIHAPALPAQPAMRQNQRVIPIAGSNREVHLWNQRAPDGSQRPHYAIMERQPGDAEPVLVGRERQTSYNIGLRYAQFDPLRATPGIDARLVAPAANELFLVQFWAVPLDEMRAQIEAMGGTIYRFLEDNTHIVRMPAGIAENVRRLNYVRWVGPFHPAYKLDDSIISALVQGFQENGGVAGSRQGLGEWFTAGEYSIEMFERGPAAQQRVQAFIEAIGGSVSVTTPDGYRIQAHLSPQQIIRVARLNGVHFIEPWGLGGPDMNLVRQLGGANYVEGLTGISGQGVRAEVFDSELRQSHQEFTGLPIFLHGGINPASAHGTSVFSIMFAQGASANARGLLPDAQQAWFYHYRNSSQFGGPTSRLTIANESVTNQVVIQTSSIGSPRVTAYTTLSAEMDDVIFQSQLLHTQSQSNAGNQLSRPQAWAKNIVSGGATNHEDTASRADDNWSFGASIGPAADGRIKPDLLFFYDFTLAANNASNTSYTQFGGTSGATPSIGGYMGLFHQMWHENTWEGSGRLDNSVAGHTVFNDRPSPMLPKAALANTAFRYDWNSGGPNSDITRFVQGWGMPDLQNLYDMRGKTYYADEPFILTQGQSKTHIIKVAAAEPQLNVTMAYLDPMGTTSATTHRINDVSLKVTSPTGTVYWGNNGLTAGNFSTSGGSSNTKDTVENVFINNPAAGDWTVEVIADVVVQDAHVETPANDVDYALWVTGGTESGSIKTTFRGGNGNAGAMFDITAHEPITISGFDIQHTATTSITVEVYSVAGGFAGHEIDPGAWTLMGSQTLTPNGDGTATHVNIGGLSIAAGQTVGLYVTGTGIVGGFMRYSNGKENWDNGEVAISTGVGSSYPFAGTNSSRSWNGVVYYDTAPPSVFVETFPTTGHAASNFIPFGSGTTTMHQVFDAGLFSALLPAGSVARISDIAFSPGVTGAFSLGAVDINLGYTNAAPGSLALPSAGTNPSGPMTSFFSDPAYSVNITAAGSEEWSEMVFTGSFDYDPAQGNLLVEIIVPDAANTSLHVSRAAGGPESSRAYDTSRFGNSASNSTATRMQFTFTPEATRSVNLCYDVVDIGGGLFEYTFALAPDPGWVPGMGWRWFIFGDQQSAASPIADFAMTSGFPVGPWTTLSSSGGFHNGPTFAPVLDYWIPASASETLTWSGTSATRLGPGQLLYSTIAGTIGGAVPADFRVATVGCPNLCPPCACDWDGSPVCTLFDFLAFQTAFVGSDPCACDLDGSPACTLFDFLEFQTQFVGGCP